MHADQVIEMYIDDTVRLLPSVGVQVYGEIGRIDRAAATKRTQ